MYTSADLEADLHIRFDIWFTHSINIIKLITDRPFYGCVLRYCKMLE